MNEAFAAYLKTLEKSEWLSLRELARQQEQLLERLVRHALTIPFYRDRLACLVAADGDLDLARWNDVPILQRTDILAHGAEMRAAELPEYHGEVTEIRTSGTSGTPLQGAVNALVSFGANAQLTRMARWFGLDTAQPLASIRRVRDADEAVYPGGKVSQGWSRASPEAPFFLLRMETPVAQQLEWLARVRAPYLLTQPSIAMALADAVSPAQGRALAIEFVFAFGETIADGAREFVAERLGARMAGIYSSQEVGAIATECPAAPHYHVATENALVEILDEERRDVAPGQRGQVIVTALYNYAMPFIRYALGDVALAGTGPCPCGRSLPVIAQVEGRTRNAFIMRDGTRIWPRGWFAREMRAFVPFRQYQMVQIDYDRIEFRYVPDGSGREPDLEGLTAYARRVMHPSLTMSVLAMDTLPRGPGGKFEDIISLVPTIPPR